MGLSDGEHRSVPKFNQQDLVDAIVKGYYGEEGYNGVEMTPDAITEEKVYYDLFGNSHNSLQKGINIIRMKDGKVKKIMKP